MTMAMMMRSVSITVVVLRLLLLPTDCNGFGIAPTKGLTVLRPNEVLVSQLPTGTTLTFLTPSASTTALFSSNNNNDNNNKDSKTAAVSESTQTPKKGGKNKGVYARPSAAIERGSGFFIPGLEGPRVRLVFGVVLLVLTGANHFLLTTAGATNQLAEVTGVLYAVLLLLQAAIEFGKESRGYVVSLDRPSSVSDSVGEDSNTASLVQQWSTENSKDNNDDSTNTRTSVTSTDGTFREKVEWSAASYVALTPANNLFLIGNDRIVYRLGDSNDNNSGPDQKIIDGCRSALSTLSKAKSGRVSIPTTHPAAVVAPTGERTIVLQTIDDDNCLMMTSDQVLQAFTDQDLRWLGQIAKYVCLQP